MQETMLQQIEQLEKEKIELTEKLWRLKEVVVPQLRAQITRYQRDSQHSTVADLQEKLKESEDVVRLLQEQLDSLHQRNAADVFAVNNGEETHPKTVYTDEVRLYRDQAEHYATLYADLRVQFDKRQKLFEDREVELSEMMTLRQRLDDSTRKLEDMQADVLVKDQELQRRRTDYETLRNEYQATKSQVEVLLLDAQQVPVQQRQVMKKDEHTTMDSNVKEEPEHFSDPHSGQRRGSGAHQKMEETKRRELFRLRTCVESLQNSLKMGTKENGALSEELDKVENDKKELEIQLKRAHATVEQLSDQVQRLEGDVATKVESIKRLSEKISIQAADMKHLEEIQMGIADENERQAEDIAALQKTLREKEMAVETMQSAERDSDTSRNSLALLEDQLVEKETRIKTMHARLEDRARELDSKDRELRLWKDKLRTLQKEKDDIESEAIAVKLQPTSIAEIDAAQGIGFQQEQLAKAIQDRDAKIEALRLDLRQMRDGYESSLEAKELALSKQRKQVALLEEKLSANRVQTAELFGGRDAEVQQLTSRLAQAMSDAQAKKSKITVLEERLREANQKIVHLEATVNDIQKSRDKAASVAVTADVDTHQEPQSNAESISDEYVLEQAAVAQDFHCKLLEENTELWRLMNERAELHSKLEQCQSSLREKEDAFIDFKKRYRSLEKRYSEDLKQEEQKVAALETDLQSMSNYCRSRSDMVCHMEGNLRTAQLNLSAYKHKEVEQQEEIAALQKALAEARSGVRWPTGPAQQLPLSKERLFSTETNLSPVVMKQRVEPLTHQQIQDMMSSSSLQHCTAPDPYGRNYRSLSLPPHHSEQRTHHTRAGSHRNRPAPYDTEIPGSTEV